MADTDFDVLYIGAGPGGYVSAIRAAQLGLAVGVIEKRASLGGTCLNVGCIPSKAMLRSSEKFAEASHELAAHGVKVGSVELDLATMLSRKDKVVKDLTKGVAFLFDKNDVEWIVGEGRILEPGRVRVTDGKGQHSTLTAQSVVIATGSESTPLAGVEVDEKRIVTSTGALEFGEVPKHLVVIGAGYIGLEMGSVWRRLGAEVTVVEFLDRITPGMDGEISKLFQRVLGKQGFKFKLGTKVTAAKTAKSGVTLTLEPAKGGDTETLQADAVLVAIGRRPYVDGLGIEELGIRRDNRGFIQVDEAFQTSVPGIYAIGDCIPGAMLAHKAEEEGVALAEILGGEKAHVNYDVIPGIVYTWPEVASVGKTEEQLKDAGVHYRVGKFPFTANARAKSNADTDGVVKVIADAKSDRVLGAHILGPDAGTLIHEVVMAMEFGASAEDIGRTCHGHPTLNEAVKEAALAVDGRALHI
jgi:dihydrolipoamide dehydrogenase